jgi:glycosyltransferase involved in cell wall biosynthesis
MRVLLLSVAGRIGGAERVLLDALAGLRRVAPTWELAVLSGEDGPLIEASRERGARTAVLPLPEPLATLGESGRSPLSTAVSSFALVRPLWQYRRLLAAHVADVQPTIVHSHGLKMHLLSASIDTGVPVLWHMHDYPSARRLSARLLRWTAPRAAGVVAPSHSVAADARRVLGPTTRIDVLHNPVEVDRFRSDGPLADLDQRCGLAAAERGTVRIGLVATYARWKGHGLFLRALASLRRDRPWRAYIVGGPVYQTRGSQVSEGELRQEAARLEIADRVGFAGFLPDTSPALRALDIVVHASTAPEPFGLTVAEAMATGRAVVVSALGGVTELFKDGHDAIGFEAGNAQALACVIEQLAADPPLRARLGAAARESARERFGLTRFGRELAAHYQRVTLGGAAPGQVAC